jgi:hypothetical protein
MRSSLFGREASTAGRESKTAAYISAILGRELSPKLEPHALHSEVKGVAFGVPHMNKILLAVFSMSLAGAASAQAGPDTLEAHLVRNAEVFGKDGAALGIIDSVDLDGSVVIRELRVPKTVPSVLLMDADDSEDSPPPEDAVLKVLPAGMIVWTGYGLRADITQAELKGLPDPED